MSHWHSEYPVKINVELPTISKLGLLKQQPSQPALSVLDLTLPPIQHPHQWDWSYPGRTQSDGSPKRHPARQTRVCWAPAPRGPSELLLSPMNLIANTGKCNYVSPEGELCGVSPRSGRNRDLAKHWLTCHAMRELEKIEYGHIEMSQATIITTQARMLVATRFRIRCPHSPCRKPTCYYVRPEGLAEHLTTCSAGPDIPPPSYELAKEFAHEWMAEMVQYDRGLFRNGYEAAVWKILHAS
ncbi:hypothetical protein JB92DRAFT_3148051 [Gautieria morchelliformis]|nr:hypothetical protein JB92DRAFT_3148051 [Gautieria morchelliformis]